MLTSPAMKSQYDGTNQTVISSVAQANDILVNDDFYNRIAMHDYFDYTDETPKNIAQWIKESNQIVTVRLYKGAFWSSVTGYVDDRYPNTIFLNSRKLDRYTSEIANTIIHECVHAADTELTDASFGHGDNEPEGKGNTAPYWIGNLAERILSGEKRDDDETIVNDPIRFIEESVRIDESLIEDE